jgi:hypothetical protein
MHNPLSFAASQRWLLPAATFLLTVSLLAACGGGGGGGDEPPHITAQPAAVTVGEGDAATFTVGATGGGGISYQWQRDGTPVAGATSASYRLAATRVADDGGAFSVSVSDGAHTVLSQPAVLSVTGTKRTGTLGAAGGVLQINSNGVATVVTVPAGALSADTVLTLQSKKPLAGELARIDISPPGLVFGVPITVAMTLPADHGVSSRQMAALRIGTRKVFVPSTVDAAAHAVTAQLSYFGLGGGAATNGFVGPRARALSAGPLDTSDPPDTLTLDELAILQPQAAVVNQALVDLQLLGRFQDAAALQLSIAALKQSEQVPEWQVDAHDYLLQAGVTTCAALAQATSTAQGTTVASYGDYMRTAKDVIYWASASQALGAEGCTDASWIGVLQAKASQALTFVTGRVSTPPAPAQYDPVASEIGDANSLGRQADVLQLHATAADIRSLYVGPAVEPLRVAAFQTSQGTTDQSEYATLLRVFGPMPMLIDDAQYAATSLTLRSRSAGAAALDTATLGRGATVGTPTRSAYLRARTDGTLDITGNIGVLHCPNAASERLQVLFEGIEVAALQGSADTLLGTGAQALPTLQASALLSAAGITPANATQHRLEFRRTGSSCATAFGLIDTTLAVVTLDFASAPVLTVYFVPVGQYTRHRATCDGPAATWRGDVSGYPGFTLTRASADIPVLTMPGTSLGVSISGAGELGGASLSWESGPYEHSLLTISGNTAVYSNNYTPPGNGCAESTTYSLQRQ